MKDRNWLLIVVAGAVVLGLAAVIAVLAIPTEPRQMVLGEERPFGGFDPHLAISVTDVRRLGEDERTEIDRHEGETIWAITVEARNTAVENTVDPTDVVFSVRDDSRQFRPLPTHDGFASPLRPSEAARKVLLFRLPNDLSRPMIWITWDDALLHAFPWLERTMLFPKAALPLAPSSG
ncbi:MAG TPA: hypothetical protein VMT85_14410 [Thermoanaerobaculia bacterium]|nr:hypothetical protein [Thermoanaerobaculia bacterium]